MGQIAVVFTKYVGIGLMSAHTLPTLSAFGENKSICSNKRDSALGLCN